MLSASLIMLTLAVRIMPNTAIVVRSNSANKGNYKSALWNWQSANKNHYFAKQRQENIKNLFKTHRSESIPMFGFKKISRRTKHIPISRNVADLPSFDSLPGDGMESPPIFIFSVPRGEMILNTMFSAQKYPMQEPVPGQTLYPPTTPLFKPIPVVTTYSAAFGKRNLRNLTMIPFYEHEALPYKQKSNIAPTDKSILLPTTIDQGVESSKHALRRARKKKPFKYYHSVNEVHWRPNLPVYCTTQFPYVIDSPIKNHRLHNEITTTPATPSAASAVYDQSNERNDRSRFKIIYETEEDETRESVQPKLSSRYAVAKNYYRFPAFSLGKLMKSNKPSERNQFRMESETLSDNNINNISSNNVTDTWFIINSTYKGHQSKTKLDPAYSVDNYDS